jgi:hypothetical protein
MAYQEDANAINDLIAALRSAENPFQQPPPAPRRLPPTRCRGKNVQLLLGNLAADQQVLENEKNPIVPRKRSRPQKNLIKTSKQVDPPSTTCSQMATLSLIAPSSSENPVVVASMQPPLSNVELAITPQIPPFAILSTTFDLVSAHFVTPENTPYKTLRESVYKAILIELLKSDLSNRNYPLSVTELIPLIESTFLRAGLTDLLLS